MSTHAAVLKKDVTPQGSDYEIVRHKELGAEADQPHRLKYKPLARA